jgi:hypothetical protein
VSSDDGPQIGDVRGGGPATSVETIEKMNAGYFAEIIQITKNYQDHPSGGEARSGLLAEDLFIRCAASELDRLLREAASDEQELREVEVILERHRLAVIAGDPDVGKGTLALLAAARVRGEGKLARPVSECSPLGLEIRMPLDRLCRQGKLGPGIFLLRDFLAKGNRDLTRLVEELDGVRLASLSESLRAADTFLLLTSDTADLDKSLLRLEGLRILHRTAGPAHDQVSALLARKAEELTLPPRVDEPLRQRVRELVASQRDHIVEELRTPPRVLRFLDRYLIAVASGSILLGPALERVDHLADWLLQDLASDRETQAFALALVLAHPHPQYVGAPWLLVHELARAISRHLRVALREPRNEHTAIVDESRLERLYAEVRRFPYPGVDLACFKDDSYSERLWQVLLGPGRELLSLLVPLLRRLAEDPQSNVWMQYAAARALGRGGEMDARALVFPAIARWVQSPQPAHHLALGHLLQGVLGSSVTAFRDACLGQARGQIESVDGERVWPLAVALRELGCLDPGSGVDGLVLLAAGSLGDDVFGLDAGQREDLRQFEGLLRARAVPDLDAKFRELLTPILFNPEPGRVEARVLTLAAVQYALVGLCYFHGPLLVVRELAVRLAEHERGRLEPLLPLLMLRHGGIVDELESNPKVVAAPFAFRAATRVVISRLLAAAAEPQGARDLAELLSTCYLWCGPFPGAFARALRNRLLDLLRDWGRQVVKLRVRQPETWEAGRALFARLLRSRSAELKEEISLLFEHDPEFSAPGSELARLGREATVVAAKD